MNLNTCKRTFVSLLMALVMLTTWVSAATTDYTASIMRLEKAIGFYSVSNSIGNTVTVRDGGRIYTGYQVKTGLGYAWISLDDDKVIKLGWNTQVTITKDGNKLEVLVESGEIFFDISEALDEDESLAIRTSTMYSGIRGTSGTVSVRTQLVEDDNGNARTQKVSTLTVYDGTVATTTLSNDTQAPQTELVSASQQATATADITDSNSGTVEIQVTDLSVTEALSEAPFAAVEVAESADLQERIEQANQETTDSESLSSVLDTAQDTLTTKEETDTAQAEATEQAVADAQEEAFSGSDAVESAFSASTSSSSSSSSSSGNSGGSSDPVTYTVTYYYDDDVFATLTVNSGDCAVATIITPTQDGAWTLSSTGSDFDFASTITGNTNLVWA